MMNFESRESPSEAFPKLEVVANMLQIQLMPLAYGYRHGTEYADMKNPEIRTEAAKEWVAYYAETFREYIEDHTRETIDLGDQESIKEFWQRFLEYTGETVH